MNNHTQHHAQSSLQAKNILHKLQADLSPIPSVEAMTQALVAAESVSGFGLNDLSNIQVIDLLAQWCTDLGMTTSVIELPIPTAKIDQNPPPPKKFNLVACLNPLKPSQSNNSSQSNSSSRLPNKPTQTGITFAGHSDTVGYNSSQWHTPPLELHLVNNAWVGMGVCDMKIFFALSLAAIRNMLQKYGQESLAAPITFIATADEETTMAGAKALQQTTGFAGNSHNFKPQPIIVGEPTEGQAIYSHKGVIGGSIILEGVSGHASNPALGASAIEAANWVMNQLTAWRQELSTNQQPIFKVPYPSVNFGCIHGGKNGNAICDRCELIIDIRMLPNMTRDTIHGQLKARLSGLAEAVPGTKLSINTDDYFDPLVGCATADIVQAIQNITGLEATTANFATEAPIFAQMGYTPVVFGPGSIDWAHKPNEQIPISTLLPMIDHLENILTTYAFDLNSDDPAYFV